MLSETVRCSWFTHQSARTCDGVYLFRCVCSLQQEIGLYTQVACVCCAPIVPVVCAMGTSPTMFGCGLRGLVGSEAVVWVLVQLRGAQASAWLDSLCASTAHQGAYDWYFADDTACVGWWMRTDKPTPYEQVTSR
jgi:hypothetical protein